MPCVSLIRSLMIRQAKGSPSKCGQAMDESGACGELCVRALLR